MSIEEDVDPVEYLQSLNLEDFLKCDNTHNIIIENHHNTYEMLLKYKIENLYKTYNTGFRDNELFGKDWENKLAESFSHLVYNFIALKPDLTIFYDNPTLAIDLLSLKNN